MLPAWPLLQNAPLGDGHAIIVFPGLTAGDASTLPLRRYLESRNYHAYGWGQGHRPDAGGGEDDSTIVGGGKKR